MNTPTSEALQSRDKLATREALILRADELAKAAEALLGTKNGTDERGFAFYDLRTALANYKGLARTAADGASEDSALLSFIETHKMSVSYSDRADGFIVQECGCVIGNIGRDRAIREAIKKAVAYRAAMKSGTGEAE